MVGIIRPMTEGDLKADPRLDSQAGVDIGVPDPELSKEREDFEQWVNKINRLNRLTIASCKSLKEISSKDKILICDVCPRTLKNSNLDFEMDYNDYKHLMFVGYKFKKNKTKTGEFRSELVMFDYRCDAILKDKTHTINIDVIDLKNANPELLADLRKNYIPSSI